MTDYYLDSTGGAASSPYANWTDAAATLDAIITARGAGVAAGGDRIFMHKNHADTTQTGAKTWDLGTIADPVPIYRVDKDSSDAPAHARDTADAVNFPSTGNGQDQDWKNAIIYGAYFDYNSQLRSPSASTSRIERCRYYNDRNNEGFLFGGTASDSIFSMKDCYIDSGAGALRIETMNTLANIEKCEFVGDITANGLLLPSATRSGIVTFSNCDFSGITSTDNNVLVDMSAAADAAWEFNFINCKWPTPTGAGSFALTDDVFSNDWQAVTSYSSDAAGNLFMQEKQTYRGAVVVDDTVYHNDGWLDADQATNLSWDMQASSVCEIQAPLQSFDIVQWYDSTGTVTVTVEAWDGFATALQDDEAWMEVFYLDGTSVLVSMDSTQVKYGDTAAALTTPGVGPTNWTGEPSGRSVKFVSASLTIGKKGFITARIYLGKYVSGESLFVDPVMTIA